MPQVRAFRGKVLSVSFFLSLWLSHSLGCYLTVSSLRLSSGHSDPVLTLSNAAHASLFSPCLLVADASVWATSPLGVAIRRIFCGVFFFPSQLCCPLSFQNSHRPAGERVSWCLETFPPSQLPPWDRSPSLTLFLSFCLLYFALPSFEESGLPFWVPGVSVRVQKLFCESCSAFK